MRGPDGRWMGCFQMTFHSGAKRTPENRIKWESARSIAEFRVYHRLLGPNVSQITVGEE